mmetsp:Transcript_82264/g.209071  ORF Transcript_82264/g.209071 Transcript_82264/m.209071 type:complete len:294 (-) Transcript_82264:70-951(-)
MARLPFETSRVKLIFAEDDFVFQEIAKPAILRAGIPDDSVFMAENGEEALEFLDQLQSGDINDPIVMLLDMRMPTMDGDTAAKKVQELQAAGKLKREPYLVCCSAGFTQVGFGGEDGSDGTFHLTMPKPFSNNEVALVLENAAKWWGPGSVSTAAAARGGGGAGKDFDKAAVCTIIVDHEPICRMALSTALSVQGIDEDKVVMCDGPDEVADALKEAQATPGAPLMLVLAQSQWADAVADFGSMANKPFLVCSSVADGGPSSDRFDAVLPSGFQQSDMKDLLEKFRTWWARCP